MTDMIMISKKNVILGGFIAILIIYAVVITAYLVPKPAETKGGNGDSKPALESYQAEKAVEKAKREAVAISTSRIKDSMEDIEEISVKKHTYDEAVSMEDYKKIGSWNVPITKKSALIEVNGVIKAGVDLTGTKKEVISVRGKDIIITLPHATILSNEYLPDEMYIYDESHNITNQISASDVAAMVDEAMNSAEEKAIEDGLLRETEERLEVLIRERVEALYPNEKINVIVNFED